VVLKDFPIHATVAATISSAARGWTSSRGRQNRQARQDDDPATYTRQRPDQARPDRDEEDPEVPTDGQPSRRLRATSRSTG
jgi:hypothetical protein